MAFGHKASFYFVHVSAIYGPFQTAYQNYPLEHHGY